MSNFLVVSALKQSWKTVVLYYTIKKNYVKIDSIKFVSYPFQPISTSYTHRPRSTHIHTIIVHSKIFSILKKKKKTGGRASFTVINKSCFEQSNIGSA